MPRIISLAWRNMWRNWRRTLIAIIAIVLGLVLLIFMDGLIKGSDQAIFGNAVRLYGGNIQIHAPGYRERANRLPMYPLDDADMVVQTVKSMPDVLSVSKRINTAGIVSSRQGGYPVLITGIEPETETVVSIVAENVSEGRFLQAEDEDGILIGKGLAEFLDVTVGDRINLLGKRREESMRQRSMTIIGIYDLGLPEAEKSTVFINLPEAQLLYNLRGQTTEVTVSLKGVGQEKRVIAALQDKLPGYEVDSWDTLKPEFRQMMNTKSTFSSIFGFIVVLIACIGILNIMMVAVFERTREMGVLSALGLKGRELMALFLLEGLFIGAVGAVIGCILAVVLVVIVAQVGIDLSFASGMGEITALMGDRMYPATTFTAVLLPGIAVALIGMLASLFPAWQATRKEPAEALHYV